MRIEKVGEWGADTKVRVNRDGSLTLLLPPFGSKRFRLAPAGHLLFRTDDGFYVAFGESPGGKIVRMYLSGPLFDPISFDRIRWYERGALHAALGAAGFVVFLGFRFVSLVLQVRRKRRDQHREQRSTPRWAWLVATWVSTLVILSPVSFLVWYFAGNPEMRPYKVESGLHLSLVALMLAVFFGLTLPGFAAAAWKRGYWSRTQRIYYTFVAVAAVLMEPFLMHWNLLGFHF